MRKNFLKVAERKLENVERINDNRIKACFDDFLKSAAKASSKKTHARSDKPDLGFFDQSREDIVTIIKTVFGKLNITTTNINKLISSLKFYIKERIKMDIEREWVCPIPK